MPGLSYRTFTISRSALGATPTKTPEPRQLPACRPLPAAMPAQCVPCPSSSIERMKGSPSWSFKPSNVSWMSWRLYSTPAPANWWGARSHDFGVRV